MCVDSSDLNSPVAMETDVPLIEDVQRLKKTVEEGATQVNLTSSLCLYQASFLNSFTIFIDLFTLLTLIEVSYSSNCYCFNSVKKLNYDLCLSAFFLKETTFSKNMFMD